MRRAFVLVAACQREAAKAPPRPPAEATTDARTAIVARTADAFYDPPMDAPNQPGALLRSEPLRHVTLPDGMQGWRILYTTTIDVSNTGAWRKPITV